MDNEHASMSPEMFNWMLEDLIKEAQARTLSVEAIAAALDESATALRVSQLSGAVDWI
ncbi:MAG TPA: hypothetical protein VMB73_30545 [Acetobacteraceae bacterium]|nr:hypothetical protein [Acetobacteraceae bacterium]